MFFMVLLTHTKALNSTRGRARSEQLSLQQDGFRLDTRTNFLTLRRIKLWNRFPREGCRIPVIGSGLEQVGQVPSEII